MARFVIGPAAATSTMSRLGLRRRAKFTGTGFAQPKRNPELLISSSSGRITLPSGSMCGNGFSVNRPARFAVSSPSALAA